MCLAMDALSAWLASNRLLYLTLPRANLSGWEVADVWLVLTGPLLPLPFQFPHIICFQDSVRDLGVILHQELSFSLHINQLTRSCYYQLRQLRVVSRFLSCSAAAALVHAVVTSRLDHCISILAGLPLAQTARLDRVLRCAARLIGRIPKYGSV